MARSEADRGVEDRARIVAYEPGRRVELSSPCRGKDRHKVTNSGLVRTVLRTVTLELSRALSAAGCVGLNGGLVGGAVLE